MIFFVSIQIISSKFLRHLREKTWLLTIVRNELSSFTKVPKILEFLYFLCIWEGIITSISMISFQNNRHKIMTVHVALYSIVNLDAKGVKGSVKMCFINFYESFFKSIVLLAVKNSYSTHVGYTPDGLFWLNLYIHSVVSKIKLF